MPYGLKDEDFDNIQNKIVKKLYEITHHDYSSFLVECTELEMKEAVSELYSLPRSKGKIEAIEKELESRKRKNKKRRFFPNDMEKKRFEQEWIKVCERIRGNKQEGKTYESEIHEKNRRNGTNICNAMGSME